MSFGFIQQKWYELAPNVPIHFFQQCSQTVMEAADVVLVTSGTATLETMLHKRPMVIAYRTGPVTFQIARWLVKVSFIGLPNLLANERLVPEFIQHEATPERLSAALIDYLDHPDKVTHLEKKFTVMHQELRQNASKKAAQAILNLISKSST